MVIIHTTHLNIINGLFSDAVGSHGIIIIIIIIIIIAAIIIIIITISFMRGYLYI
jgi:ABC-type multidrug transport system permease subunit